MGKKVDARKSAVCNEIYQRLRSNIEFAGPENRVIAITGCGPNDGKSTVSFNLATVFAENGRKSIFVDADMRKPALLERLIAGKYTAGLSHYLLGQCDLDKVITRSEFEHLDLIYNFMPPSNPTELLSNSRFKEMLEKLKEKYNCIIVDTPSLSSVIDAAIIARNCDGVVLVIPSNTYTKPEILMVKEQLEAADSNILGVVLNRYNTRKSGLKRMYIL